MRKMTWLAGLALGLTLTAGGAEALAADTSSGSVIHTGVYIDGIDVSGMTEAEARAEVEDYVEEMGTETLTLNIGDNQLQTTLGDLGLSCTNMEVVEEAAQLGKTGNIIQRYKDRKDLEHENKNYQLEWTLDSDLVTEYVNSECTQFDQEAVDASLEKNGSTFTYVAGEEGLLLDVDGSVEAILNYIENEWDYIEGSVDLPVEIDEPRGTEEELSKVQDELGTYTTSYKTSNSNRAGNIARGAELINGTVLYPGDTFSAYEAGEPLYYGERVLHGGILSERRDCGQYGRRHLPGIHDALQRGDTRGAGSDGAFRAFHARILCGPGGGRGDCGNLQGSEIYKQYGRAHLY